jgi:polyisoprenoid-binding protein YceI
MLNSLKTNFPRTGARLSNPGARCYKDKYMSKRLFYPAAAMLLLAGSAFTLIATQSWQIADGYSIAFSSNDASGIFKDFKGTVLFDEQNPAASKFDVTIGTASINTGNGLQNKHAKSDEWFDVAKYPQIHYSSQKIVKAGNGYQVTGDLEMHGVKKSITIPFTFQKTAKGALFAGSFTVNRNDFKVGKPGEEVGEQIKIDLSVPVTK